MKRALLLIAVLAPAFVFAQDKVIWACHTAHPDARPILHLVDWGDRDYVKFAQFRFSANQETVDGTHSWYWGDAGDGFYRYAIALEPDGSAWYQEFPADSEAGSRHIDRFRCSETPVDS